jgi:threonine aldolase
MDQSEIRNTKKGDNVMISENYLQMIKQAQYQLRGHKTKSMKDEMAIFNTLKDCQMPDVYGKGEVIEAFQNTLSKEFNKQSAVFFPSGTMAQQIALRIWCDQKGLMCVAYHPLCHLEIHEQDGIKELHHIDTVLLGEKDHLFTIDDLKNMKDVAAVLFELPQREIGGQLPSWNELIEMTAYCKERGIRTHLDGARLYECLPYYQKTPSEVGELFDSIYISFYKGFGSITGAMLIGDEEIIREAKIWKRRLGGDLYHLYPYIVPAADLFAKRKGKMAEYYEYAKAYALKLSSIKGISIHPTIPVSNMFHVHFNDTAERVMTQMIDVMKMEGVALFGGINATAEGFAKTEISIGDNYGLIEESIIDKAIERLRIIRS